MKNLITTLTFSSTLFFLACDDDIETLTITDTVTEIETDTVTVTEGVEVLILGNITADATWSADSVYILGGRIAVISGVTLTIEAGTIIKGQYGTGANATSLVVARGAILNAQGTSTSPIIFTAVADKIQPGEILSPNMPSDAGGLWGGVIILGNAPASLGDDALESNIEGIPTSDINGLYGGTDAADNSGTISYISIRHGGSNIGEGNEINGLTLGGVGSATSIEGVEVVANADDGIEWFGGTVNVSKVLIWNSNDDGLDTDQDWQGTCSDYIIVTPQGGSAFELDGPEGTAKVNGADGFHTFSNGVVYVGADADHVVDWDGATNAALGGDGAGVSLGWETTLDEGDTLATVLGADAAAITSEVAAGARTKGPAKSVFDTWTWAGLSGALTTIGL